MTATPSVLLTSAWEAVAKELLTREWDVHCGREAVSRGEEGAGHAPVVVGSITWIVPELLDLVVQNHDRPVSHLAPRVRHILTEANFVEECGDGVPPLSPEEIEHQTSQIIEVLEKMRCAALADSRWSDAPVTPIMFG